MSEDIFSVTGDRIDPEDTGWNLEEGRKRRFLVTRNKECSGSTYQIMREGAQVLHGSRSYASARGYADRYLGRRWRRRVCVDIWDSYQDWRFIPRLGAGTLYVGRQYRRVLSLSRDGTEAWFEPIHLDAQGTPHTPFDVKVRDNGGNLVRVCRRCHDTEAND
jgi:hypothetical protein